MIFIQIIFDITVQFGYILINLMLMRKLYCTFFAHALEDAEHPDSTISPGVLLTEADNLIRRRKIYDQFIRHRPNRSR